MFGPVLSDHNVSPALHPVDDPGRKGALPTRIVGVVGVSFIVLMGARVGVAVVALVVAVVAPFVVCLLPVAAPVVPLFLPRVVPVVAILAPFPFVVVVSTRIVPLRKWERPKH